MANNGFILYEGPSLIDGKPIVVIATVKSNNRKTGAMVQTWIIRSDIDPITASRLGEDFSICGDCVHRGIAHDGDKGQAKERSCYVMLLAVLAIYKAYHDGKYEDATGHEKTRAVGLLLGVRLGSYGDPMACPSFVWDSLTSGASFVTAYTHQQNNLKEYVMTSADSLRDAESAWSRGERTFRVISALDKLVRGKEVLCPASKEAGERVQCADCKLCGGASVKAKSVAIVAHGASHVTRAAKERVE